MIALTGATGFVGSRLLERLRADGEEVRPLTRRPGALDGSVLADVLEPGTLDAALAGVDVAYYLVHALEGAGDFGETEATGARNFAAAAERAGVHRIVYLGGLAHGNDLSDHLRSRREVGRLLAASSAAVVELRASVVIGEGSLSFDLVRTLVDTSPVLALPDWIDTPCQPVAVDDLVEYLLRARDVDAGVYEIGGADVLSYRDLISAYAEVTGKVNVTVGVPVLAGPPSALVDALPERLRASAHLVESLRYDSTVHDDASSVFGIRPAGVHEAIRRTQPAPR